MGSEEKQGDSKTSGGQSTEIKFLAEYPRCRGEGAKGFCGFDGNHPSAHRCNRCSSVWE